MGLQADTLRQSTEDAALAVERNLPEGNAATVSFQNVWLQYSPGPNHALKGISFDAHAGESLAICGRTGKHGHALIPLPSLLHLMIALASLDMVCGHKHRPALKSLVDKPCCLAVCSALVLFRGPRMAFMVLSKFHHV